MPNDNELIEQAIRAGKFPPSRRPHYRKLMDADPVGTRQLIARLASSIPLSEVGRVTAGGSIPGVAPRGEAYPKEWLGPIETPSDRITVVHD